MVYSGIANNKIVEVTKLRPKPFVFPYHPLPSTEDPVDYTNMMKTNIFGYTSGYVGQKSFYPAKGMLREDPEYHLIRNPSEYVRDSIERNCRSTYL